MTDESAIRRFVYTDDHGNQYEIFVEARDVGLPEASKDLLGDQHDGRGDDIPEVKMQRATDMIRGYTTYAVSAFKEFSAARVEEITLKFGLKIGGKVGIPYITEGSAESNLEIQVKCTFPDAHSATEPETVETS
ncbi:hypothetical protein KR51_00019340 [Rubidibacter lacunae KORDI 51-2]|uniref:Trypsin-co-occurring domain-containing protein n=1 Tax=Rubidibacter lacunae KORDI 51-2 TaxID=582515 RepID=U5DKC3_9CHRO|nr:CU044_2847 family protein [Rubidibacter lacunae]ERN41367.1 hypothetical protein KR51_00019340 [Rubidibacter lacunae KORDI 51-2]